MISTKFIFDFAFFLFSFVNFRRIHFLIFSSTFIQFIFSLFSRLIRNRRFCFHFAKKFVHLKTCVVNTKQSFLSFFRFDFNRFVCLSTSINVKLFLFCNRIFAMISLFSFFFRAKFLRDVRC